MKGERDSEGEIQSGTDKNVKERERERHKTTEDCTRY